MNDIAHWNITEECVLTIRDRAVAAARIVYQRKERLPVSAVASAIDWGYSNVDPGDRRWKLFATIFEDRLCYLLDYPVDYASIRVDEDGYVLQ